MKMTDDPSNGGLKIPDKNPIVVLTVLGVLNLLAGTTILVLQAGVLIVGKSVGLAHIGLALGWLVTGALGAFLLINAQSLNARRQHTIEESKKTLAKEHTKELQRDTFTFYDGTE
jgi:hypothetical protein